MSLPLARHGVRCGCPRCFLIAHYVSAALADRRSQAQEGQILAALLQQKTPLYSHILRMLEMAPRPDSLLALVSDAPTSEEIHNLLAAATSRSPNADS